MKPTDRGGLQEARRPPAACAAPGRARVTRRKCAQRPGGCARATFRAAPSPGRPSGRRYKSAIQYFTLSFSAPTHVLNAIMVRSFGVTLTLRCRYMATPALPPAHRDKAHAPLPPPTMQPSSPSPLARRPPRPCPGRVVQEVPALFSHRLRRLAARPQVHRARRAAPAQGELSHAVRRGVGRLLGAQGVTLPLHYRYMAVTWRRGLGLLLGAQGAAAAVWRVACHRAVGAAGEGVPQRRRAGHRAGRGERRPGLSEGRLELARSRARERAVRHVTSNVNVTSM